MKSAEPLARFPLVRTTSAEETRAALSCTYAKPSMEFIDREQKLQTVVNLCQLVDVGLVYASCAASLRFEYPETDLASQIFSIDGRCEVMTGGASVAIRPDCGVVTSPGESLQHTSSAEYRRLVLTIKCRALARTLSTLAGQPCGRPLRFNPKQNYALPAAKALREHFFFLVGVLNNSTAPMPSLVLAEFEQVLTVMFLCANHHNFSHLLEQAPPFVAPWQVDRAEAYIEANWKGPIALEDLADVSGVSAFSLWRSFKKGRELSPMEFASRVRLRHARDLLLRPDEATTVTGIASTCGFADVRRFESDYARAFGERPCATLDRSKGPRPTSH
jgi:AraC-like DNA-binding protein